MTQQNITLLATNPTYTLFSNSKQIFLVDSTTTELIQRKKIKVNIGSLQYGTGIVAVCKQSQILIYDMIYDKELYTYNAYQIVLKIYLMKNLLIILSQSKMTVHDLDKKENLCYLAIFSGQLAFINPNYYELKIFYPQNEQKLINRSIWKSTFQIYRGIRYQYGCYLDHGNSICLAYDNVVSVYHKQKLVHLCILQNNISMVRVFNNNLYVTANSIHFKIIRKDDSFQYIETQNKKIKLDFKDKFQDKMNVLSKSVNSEIWFTKNWIFFRQNQEVKYLKYDDMLEISSEKNKSQISLQGIQIMQKLQRQQLLIDNLQQYNNQNPYIQPQSDINEKGQTLTQKNKQSDLLNFWFSKTKPIQKQDEQEQIAIEQHLSNRLSVNMDEKYQKQ